MGDIRKYDIKQTTIIINMRRPITPNIHELSIGSNIFHVRKRERERESWEREKRGQREREKRDQVDRDERKEE